MLHFAVLRHGQTSWNKDRKIQGRSDIPLLPAIQKDLQNYVLPGDWAQKKWFVSPLLRARQTALALGLKNATVDSAWVEMDWGRWEGKTLAELRAQHPNRMQENEDKGWDFRPEDGESPRDVHVRVLKFLQSYRGSDFGVVTHKGVIRALYATARNWNMLGRMPDKLDWNALHVFCWDQREGLGVVSLNVALKPRRGESDD